MNLSCPDDQTSGAAVTIGGGERHAALIAELNGESADAAIGAAFRQMQAGADLPLLMAVVEALTREGVAGLAVKLLMSAGSLVSDRPDVAALVEELARLPSGEVPWNRLATLYRRNSEAVRHVQPHVADALHDVDNVEDHLQLFVTGSGNATVVRKGPPRRLEFVMPLDAHDRRAAELNLPSAVQCGSFTLRGVPSQPLWAHLLSIRHPNGYEPPIDVIETDVQVMAAWLHLVEIGPHLQSGRVRLFVGPDAVEHYRRFVIGRFARSAGGITIASPRPGRAPAVVDRTFFNGVQEARNCEKNRLLEKQKALYNERGLAFWADRFDRAAGGEGGLRVLGFTTRFSTVIRHAMRDLAAAFRRRGCEVDLILEPDGSSSEVDTWTALAGKPYDLVVVLNHLRSELGGRIDPRLPYVCWCQDHMQAMWSREAGRSVGDNELVLTHSPWHLEQFYEYPFENLIETANLTDAEMFSDEPAPAEDLARFQCDVSYVSHGARTPRQLALAIGRGDRGLANCLNEFVAIGEEHLATHGAIAGFDLFRLMLRAEERSGYGPLTPQHRGGELVQHVLRVYDRMLRHESLQWAADWAGSRGRRMRIYGRGWDRHPTLREFAGGEIENGYDLRCAYQASAVNLQVNGYGSLHQRLLDCLASGGFILSRFNPTDFLRTPWCRLREILLEREVCSFEGLMNAAENSAEVAEVLKKLTSLGVPCIDPVTRSCAEDLRAMEAAGVLPHELRGEAGYFRTLTAAGSVPGRVAGDIPGFAELTFRTRRRLHEVLDRFVDEPAARRIAAGPMRDSVIEHDTYDGLVGRVLSRFGELFNRRLAAAKCGTGPG